MINMSSKNKSKNLFAVFVNSFQQAFLLWIPALWIWTTQCWHKPFSSLLFFFFFPSYRWDHPPPIWPTRLWKFSDAALWPVPKHFDYDDFKRSKNKISTKFDGDIYWWTGMEKKEIKQTQTWLEWKSIINLYDSKIHLMLENVSRQITAHFSTGRLLQFIQRMWFLSTGLNFQLPPNIPSRTVIWASRGRLWFWCPSEGFRPTWLCALFDCPAEQPRSYNTHTVELWDLCFWGWRPLPSFAKQKHIHVSKQLQFNLIRPKHRVSKITPVFQTVMAN